MSIASEARAFRKYLKRIHQKNYRESPAGIEKERRYLSKPEAKKRKRAREERWYTERGGKEFRRRYFKKYYKKNRALLSQKKRAARLRLRQEKKA